MVEEGYMVKEGCMVEEVCSLHGSWEVQRDQGKG
jgi:hypothetical protein